MKTLSEKMKESLKEAEKLYNETILMNLSNTIRIARGKGLGDEDIASVLDISVEEVSEIVELAKDLGGAR